MINKINPLQWVKKIYSYITRYNHGFPEPPVDAYLEVDKKFNNSYNNTLFPNSRGNEKKNKDDSISTTIKFDDDLDQFHWIDKGFVDKPLFSGKVHQFWQLIHHPKYMDLARAYLLSWIFLGIGLVLTAVLLNFLFLYAHTMTGIGIFIGLPMLASLSPFKFCLIVFVFSSLASVFLSAIFNVIREENAAQLLIAAEKQRTQYKDITNDWVFTYGIKLFRFCGVNSSLYHELKQGFIWRYLAVSFITKIIKGVEALVLSAILAYLFYPSWYVLLVAVVGYLSFVSLSYISTTNYLLIRLIYTAISDYINEIVSPPAVKSSKEVFEQLLKKKNKTHNRLLNNVHSLSINLAALTTAINNIAEIIDHYKSSYSEELYLENFDDIENKNHSMCSIYQSLVNLSKDNKIINNIYNIDELNHSLKFLFKHSEQLKADENLFDKLDQIVKQKRCAKNFEKLFQVKRYISSINKEHLEKYTHLNEQFNEKNLDKLLEGFSEIEKYIESQLSDFKKGYGIDKTKLQEQAFNDFESVLTETNNKIRTILTEDYQKNNAIDCFLDILKQLVNIEGLNNKI